MRRDPLTEEEARKYLEVEFQDDLRTWFKIESGHWKGADFVPHLAAQFNPDRPCNGMIRADARRSHVFAAAFRAMLEKIHSVMNEKGEDGAVGFCKEHGWPICSAVLAGFSLSVEAMVREADLVPDVPSNIPFYTEAVSIFKKVIQSNFEAMQSSPKGAL